MSDSPNAINWYPGHMSKAKRQMQEDLKIIDAVVEILDARIPFSSKNPDIDQMAKNKYRIIILNKADLADRSKTDEWKRYYESKGFFVSAVDSRSGKGMKEVVELIRRACAEKIEKDRKKGILNRPIRAMIAGIPNSGKSTFINSMVGKGAAKTGNKPGVTKGKQWIRLNKDIELLDTPGILWPKFEDRSIGLKIAFIGSINDEILFPEEMVCELIGILKKEYPGTIDQRYGEGLEADENSFEILVKIAVIRACLKKGGEPDTEKAAKLVIDDLRSCKLGNITLEKVADL